MQRSNSMKKLAKLVNDDDFADDFGDVEWTSSFQRPTTSRRSSSRSVQAAAKPVTQDDLAAKAPRSRKPVARAASLSLPKKSAPPLPPMPKIAQQTDEKPSVRVIAKPVSAPATRATPISPTPASPAPTPAPAPAPVLAPAPLPLSADTTFSFPPGPTPQSTHDPQPSQAQALDDFGEFAETAAAADEFDDFAAASASLVAPGHVDDDFGDFTIPVLATPQSESSIEQSLAAEVSMRNAVGAKKDSFHNFYEPATSHVTSVPAAVHEPSLTSTLIRLDVMDDPVAQDGDDVVRQGRLGKGEADSGWVDSGGGGSGNTEFSDVKEPAGDANGFGDFTGNEPGTVDEEASLEDEFAEFGTPILSTGGGARKDYFEEVRASGEADTTPKMGLEPSVVPEVETAGNMSSDFGVPAGNENATLTRENQQALLDNSKSVIADDDDAFGDFGTPMTAVDGKAPGELETTVESDVNWNRDNELGDFATLAPSIDDGFGPTVGSTANRTLEEFDELDTPMVSAAGDLSGDFGAPARVTNIDGFEAAAVEEERVTREEAGKNDFDNPVLVTPPVGGEAGKHASDDDFGLPVATVTGSTDDELNDFGPPIASTTGRVADDDDGFGDFSVPVVGTDGSDEVEGGNSDGFDEFDGFRPTVEKTKDWTDEVRTPDRVREHGDEKANDEFGEFGYLGRAADEDDDGFGDFGGPAKRGNNLEDEFGEFGDPGNSHNEDEDKFGDFDVPVREVEKDEDDFDEFGDLTRDDSEEDDEFKSPAARRGYEYDDDGWDDEDEKPKSVVAKKAQRVPPPIALVPKAKPEVPLVALEEPPNMDWSDKASLITTWARLLNGIYPTMKPPPGSMSSAGSSDAPSSIKDFVLNAHESLHAKLTWTAVTRSMDMDDGVPKVVWKGSQIEALHLTALGYKRGMADASVSLSLPPLQEDSSSGVASPDLFSPVDSPRDSFSINQPSSPYTSPSTTTPIERPSLHKKTTSISSFGRAFSTLTQMITPSSPVHEKSLTNASSTSLASSSSSSSSPPSSTHRSDSLDSLGPDLVFPVSEQSDSPPAVSSPASHPQSARAVVSGKTTNERTANKASIGEFPFFVDQEDPVVSPPPMQSPPPPQPAGPDAWLSTNDVSFLAEFAEFTTSAAPAAPTASAERSSVLDDNFGFGDLTTPSLALPKVASILPVVTAGKLAPELQMLVDRLPDLKYMRSRVIIFPVGEVPLMGTDEDKARVVGLGIVEESGREEDEWGGWAG
ncbi:hypothetical protein BC937DRAFT_88490 [Endogone sp. FLAS-F59071]|nr:hypothetical protein BC937DRAFT_88490 [Endogone sp. FLAS-F59071]|eukprot:RUS18656.1 hypothetical protein BC937DRAFT_88490 [Endogone sp. FLAS-F59071]